MNIIFSGGGTLGPVTPLLALTDTFREHYPDARYMWIGTRRGPERELVTQAGITFHTIASGKFRRYISLWNIVDIVRIIVGFFQALVFLWRNDPAICISAGGFISVPVHYAAWLLGIPTWIHQQDIRVGLANKLMAPTATVITTALQESLSSFSAKKTFWLGNPIRKELYTGNIARARTLFGINNTLPVVFATGGGTGSMKVNQMVIQSAQHLEGSCSIIHLSGKERPQDLIAPAARQFSGHYYVYPFFTHEMKDAYAIADIVISRAGFGTLTEMAALSKVAILIPKGGHQDENASFLEEHDAAIVLPEDTSDGNHLTQQIKLLLADPQKQRDLATRLHTILPPARDEDILRIIVQALRA